MLDGVYYTTSPAVFQMSISERLRTSVEENFVVEFTVKGDFVPKKELACCVIEFIIRATSESELVGQ